LASAGSDKARAWRWERERLACLSPPRLVTPHNILASPRLPCPATSSRPSNTYACRPRRADLIMPCPNAPTRPCQPRLPCLPEPRLTASGRDARDVTRLPQRATPSQPDRFQPSRTIPQPCRASPASPCPTSPRQTYRAAPHLASPTTTMPALPNATGRAATGHD
jgi:hypothetical protein